MRQQSLVSLRMLDEVSPQVSFVSESLQTVWTVGDSGSESSAITNQALQKQEDGEE